MMAQAFYYLHLTTTAQSAYPGSYHKFSRYFHFKFIYDNVLLKFVIFSALWKSFNYLSFVVFLVQKCLDRELAHVFCFFFAKVF